MKVIYKFDNTCGRVGFVKNGIRIDKNQVLKDLNLMADHIRNEGVDLEEISGVKYDNVENNCNSKLFNRGKSGFLG